MSLITFTKQGMYVPQADVYIDPWRPVPRAFITHGHSDHARWGCTSYLTHNHNIPILQRRLGAQQYQGVAYGQNIEINGVKFSFHPAGHVLGSSQVRVEYKGEIWVASGDYKTQFDGISTAFEPIQCHTFITESTFGLPVYNWREQQDVIADINQWWQQNKQIGKCSIIFAYSLGKAQRILANVDASIGTIFVHSAVANINEAYAEAGVLLPPYQKVSADIDKSSYKGALIIAPASSDNTPWMKKFEPYSTGIASGWMALRGARRRMSADKGFVLSDHADWQGLNDAIKETNAQKVIVTHGYTQVFARWLTEQGYEAHAIETRFTGETITPFDDTDQTLPSMEETA
jgi:putative mRNA 3-end processing factor